MTFFQSFQNHFIQIHQKLLSYEVGQQTILLHLGYQTFSKKIYRCKQCFVTHNVFRAHLVTMKFITMFFIPTSINLENLR